LRRVAGVAFVVGILWMLTTAAPASAAISVQHVATWGGVAEPVGIDLDAEGDVWVLNRSGGVSEFDPDGTRLRSWPVSARDAFGIDVTPGGDVLVTGFWEDVILRYSADGELLERWGSRGSAPGQFFNIAGVATDEDGNVYVGDASNHRVQVLDSTGNFLRMWGGLGEFDGPWGIAVGPDGNVYVADKNHGRVRKYTPAGVYLATIGSPSLLAQNFGVDVDGRGNVFVADTFGHAVYEFDPDGTLAGTVASRNAGTLGFNPFDVAAGASGDLFIADSQLNLIRKYVAIDGSPPTISVPEPIAMDATSPAGADVTYTVTVVDDQDPAPSLSCDPPSGSLFPIGTSGVECEASDSSRNRSQATFTVTVRGAADQLDAAIEAATLLNVPPGARKTLGRLLRSSAAAIDSGLTGRACRLLDRTLHHLARLTRRSDEAKALADDIVRIQAVAGCA